MAEVDTALRSAGVQKITAVRDPQVFALAAVLAANVRYALDEALGAERWLENTCVDFHEFPVTLGLLHEYRLPALSAWRVSTLTTRNKKRAERRTTFAVRYWMSATPVEWIPKTWPMLQAAYEVIARTLCEDGLIDLQTPGPNGPAVVPSTELLGLAGFLRIDENTIRGAEDFAGDGNQAFPVLEVTFEAEHLPLFGGLPYSCEFPNGLELNDLVELCFELWDGTPIPNGGRGTENQPVVAGKSLLERSMEALEGDHE